MNLEELKQTIETNSKNIPLLIAVCKDETAEFIFHQYLHHYIAQNNLSFKVIDDVSIVSRPSLFSTNTNLFYVCYTNKLTKLEMPKDCFVWIRCKSISDDVQLQFKDYIVVIDKLDPWQIKDYVYTVCNKVPHSELDYLLKIYDKNIYRIENEVQKISIFDNQDRIYPIIQSQLYTDISEFNIFDLVNSLVKYDIKALTKILQEISNIDIDVFGLLKLLITNFRRVIDIQLSKNPSAQTLGMTDKQFWAIKKYSCGIYTRKQLLEIYTFLTACDYDIKSGRITTDVLLSYIIIKIINIKENNG